MSRGGDSYVYILYVHIVFFMRPVAWDEHKNRWLKETRGISFDEIIGQELLDIIRHPTKEHQCLYVYRYDGYCWIVPCVVERDRVFLKTIYPSRKFTKRYLNKEL